jgi:ferritin-like metal-binding protein YciE
MRASVIDVHLITHLMDAHAAEEQSLGLLRRARRSCAWDGLRDAYDEHLRRAEQHKDVLERRLQAHGAKPSAMKDAAMRLGALNWSSIFPTHPLTPGKATAQLFALTHLKIAGYELLRSVATRAADQPTIEMAERLLEEERSGARNLHASFDEAVEASLDIADSPETVLAGLRRSLVTGADRAPLGTV